MENIILVVDDDKTNLILAQKILSPEYRIAACNSGMAALKYLEKNKPHLILLDISMPEMDGFEVLEKLRQDQRTEAIPIIFLTADGQSDTEVKCFQMGALDFVKKPFVPDILLSRVAKTIELDQYRHNLEDMVSEQAEKLMESTQRINRIPLAARIMAVADVFDALYEERCYKPPIRPIERIMQIMSEGRGTQFDPVIIDVFVEMLPMLKEVLNIL